MYKRLTKFISFSVAAVMSLGEAACEFEGFSREYIYGSDENLDAVVDRVGGRLYEVRLPSGRKIPAFKSHDRSLAPTTPTTRYYTKPDCCTIS
jgi:hypothetical protein